MHSLYHKPTTNTRTHKKTDLFVTNLQSQTCVKLNLLPILILIIINGSRLIKSKEFSINANLCRKFSRVFTYTYRLVCICMKRSIYWKFMSLCMSWKCVYYILRVHKYVMEREIARNDFFVRNFKEMNWVQSSGFTKDLLEFSHFSKKTINS